MKGVHILDHDRPLLRLSNPVVAMIYDAIVNDTGSEPVGTKCIVWFNNDSMGMLRSFRQKFNNYVGQHRLDR